MNKEEEEKLPLFSRLNDAIDTGFQRIGEFIADAAQDRPGIGDDIVRGGIQGLSFLGNLPVIKQIGQLEDKLVDTVGNLAEKQSVIDPRSFRYVTRVGTMFIPYAGAAKVLGKGKTVSKVAKAVDFVDDATLDAQRLQSGLKMRLLNSIDPEGAGGIQNVKKLEREFPLVSSREEALDKFYDGFSNNKAKTRYYTIADTGEQVMIDLQPRNPNVIPSNAPLSKKDFKVIPYKTQSRYELQKIAQAQTRYGKIPSEVQSYIIQVYGKNILKRYKTYLKDKKLYNKQIKAELIEELKKVKLKLKEEFIKAKGTHFSHFTAVKANLTNPGYVARNFIAGQPSKVGAGLNANLLRNPPKTSGLYTSPNADQIFLEYAKANIGRSNNPAIDLASLQELGIPTNWLESLNTFLLQDNSSSLLQDFLIRKQINNYDLKDLVEGRLTADQIISKRYQSHIEDVYRIGPLDDLIARIQNDPKLGQMDKDILTERLLEEFASKNLTKGMMDDSLTLGGGTKGGPVTVKKPPNKPKK